MFKFKLLSVFFLTFGGFAYSFDLNETDAGRERDGHAREEHFRTALINAFHTIKSTKGEDLNNGQEPSVFEGVDGGAGDLVMSRPGDDADAEDTFDSFFSDDSFGFDGEPKAPDVEPRKEIHHIASIKKRTEMSRNGKTYKIIPSETAEGYRPADSNRTGIENLLEVFDIDTLARNWQVARDSVSKKCSSEMNLYLRGLRENKPWAYKMDDASGRYSSGFFWGNSFWTGSSALCERIGGAEAGGQRGGQRGGNGSTNMRSSESGSANVNVFHEIEAESPPFRPAFFMLKIQMNSTSPVIAGTKFIQIGLCLPIGCTTEDSKSLVDSAHSDQLDVRTLVARCPQQHYYDFTQDTTFRVLLVFSVIIGALLIAGTLYDLILTHVVLRRRGKVHAEAAGASTPPRPKMDLPIDALDITNGKSIYIINNTIESNNSEERLATESVTSEDTLKLSVFSELLLSFSVITNLQVICDQKVGSDTIPTIHGLKAFSMLWVILGHTCIVAFKYSDNTELRKIVEKEFLFQSVTNGAYSVDTFFCTSGLLVSFLYFRTNAKGKLEKLTKGTKGFMSGFLQFVGLLAYRFARLTAPYMFMLGVVELSMKWFYHNSIFEPPTQDHLNCPDYWWRNLLYINTLFPVEQMCMLWSWYLADDSQFYVLGAVLLIWATSHFKAAASTMTLFLVSSWATTAYIAWENNHQPSMDDPLALFDKIYDKPWTRLGPYIVGMAAGWLLFKTDCNIKLSKFAVVTGWAASIGALVWLVFGLHGTELPPIAAATYSSLSHTVWALAVAWIVVACSTGYGGYISTLLSAPILYPFSRVTYCAYLVHPVVIRFLAMHLDHPMHLGKDIMAIIFFGQAIASYILSFIVSVAVEAPFVTMLKILSPNRRKRL